MPLFLTPDAQYDDDGRVERAATGPDAEWRILRESKASDLPEDALAQADALVTWHVMPIDAGMIGRLARCRIIVRAGVGVDHIDLAAAGAAGIPVCNTPDYGVSEVADHAIGLMLALTRGIVLHDRRAGEMGSPAFGHPLPPLVRRNRGKTFGILGFGAIGMATAARARAFGMRVSVYDPYAPSGVEIACGVERAVDLDSLLASADVLSLHAPLTPETQGLIDRRAFAQLRPGAILVNTARGQIVDVPALIDALESGRLGGAALDVFEAEPVPQDGPLARYLRSGAQAVAEGRLLVTPHAAWTSPESAEDVRRLSVETAQLYLRSGRLRNLVNRTHLRAMRPWGEAA